MSKFDLGRLLATPGALAALEASGQRPIQFISRHAQGDWGQVCAEDGQLNDAALVDGSRLLSAYKTRKGIKLWIITEAADHDDKRAATQFCCQRSIDPVASLDGGMSGAEHRPRQN